MKSRFAQINILFFLALFITCGCGDKGPVERSEKGAAAIRLSMLFPEGSRYYRAARRWADLLQGKSAGTMSIEIFPGGELLRGDVIDQLELLQSGAADITLVRPAELAHLSPSLQVFSLPFLFPNRRSAEAVLDGAVGRKLLEGLGGGEVVGLGYFGDALLQLSATKRVVVPQDMAGLKLRLPQTRSRLIDGEAMKALGAEAAYMPLSDLRPALVGGTIDGQVSTVGLYNRLDLEQWQKHLTMLNYSFEPMVICAGAGFWGRLSGEQHELLRSTLLEVRRYHSELLEEGEGLAKRAVWEKGISVVELIPEELEPFRELVQKRYADMAPGIGEALIAEVCEEVARNKEPYLYRFYDNLASAFVEAPPYSPQKYPHENLAAREEGSAVAHLGGAYSFDERYGIFCPVPGRLEYDVVVPPNAKLEFGIGVRPAAREQFPDGITFAIDVMVEGGGKSRRIYEYMLSPFVNEDERMWLDELLDVDLPPGKRAKIIFSTRGIEREMRQGGVYYGAIWTNPVLYEEDDETYYRNVILISVDTLRADSLGCYGNKLEASPHIDGMAAEGAIFSNCFSQSTWTLPSHMSIMTSLYPSQHAMSRFDLCWGKEGLKLLPGFLTLAEVMRDGGYNTVAFTESGLVDSIFGFNQGFNSYVNFSPELESRTIRDQAVAIHPLALRFGDLDLDQLFGSYTRTIHLTFSKAIEWIKSRGGRKFFCFIHTFETHLPHYDNPYIRPFSPNYAGIIPYTLSIEQNRELQRAFFGSVEITDQDLAHLWALYSAQVRYTDDFIGLLLGTLKETGLDKNTLIVFTSDHGESLYSHGEFVGHGGLPHEEVARIPLIVRCGSIVPRGQRVASPCAAIDIPPTIIDFAGCRKLPISEGMSLYPSVVEGAPLPAERPIYMVGDKYLGLRFDDRKYIYWLGDDRRELYDLLADPGELENVAGESAEAEKFEKMASEFLRKRPQGYYLIFPSADSRHVFEGELTVEGVFRSLYGDGVEMDHREGSPVSSLSFTTTAVGAGQHVINFNVHPEGARVTLDLNVDGKRDPAGIFLGESGGHPESLPWEFDDSVRSSRNPYLLTASKNPGCYIFRVDSPWLADNVDRSGLKVAGGGAFLLKEAEETASDEEERAEKVRERLKALGYID